jgi:transcriptional regulator with PAS, ATPase and Fis domain
MTRIHRAVDDRALTSPPVAVEGPEVRSLGGMTAVISSAPMRSLMKFVERIAKSNAAVLVTGESGSGKELVARALHEYSPRSSQPWVDINCAALPDHLMESELFGYEKGAFSGADCGKQGMFELAHQGTLFLDEIGELDLKSQSKLLRVLDGYPYYRLGGTRKISVDVRIVAATNADLEKEVRLGRFRADLFHRINQVYVRVPALRERPDDIGPLASLFLERQNSQWTLSGDSIAALQSYAWPGNIRELKNLMARMAVMVDGPEIGVDDLPAEVRASVRPQESVPGHRLDRLEQTEIFNALAQAEGRRNRAAEMLGISRRTLIRRLKVYGVTQGRPMACSAASRD